MPRIVSEIGLTVEVRLVKVYSCIRGTRELRIGKDPAFDFRVYLSFPISRTQSYLLYPLEGYRIID